MRDPQLVERLGWVSVVGVALLVGILIGQRACTPVIEVPPAVETSPEVVERVVCRCAPDAGVARSGPRTGRSSGDQKKQNRPGRRELPPVPVEQSPLERKRLLAWVQDQSQIDLVSCREGMPDVGQITATVTLGADKSVRRVTLNAAERELPAGFLSCVRAKVSGWQFPPELVKNQDTLIFGIRL